MIFMFKKKRKPGNNNKKPTMTIFAELNLLAKVKQNQQKPTEAEIFSH